MTRPAVSVVMPFAGSSAQARAALATLRALRTAPGDELILADNSETAAAATVLGGVLIVRATAERSPSHARNAGAERATGEWILFVDADCDVPADLIDRYLEQPVADDVGALAGAIVPAPGVDGFAARYGAAKSFLDTDAHLAHGYLPRAAAANLLVRRAAFTAVGGFSEGVRAAEDTDFSWRLQRGGWRLEARPAATVQHRYRTTVRALRRQWRGYAAGRAWLGRRYDGFAPEPALTRAARRVRRRPVIRTRRAVAPPAPAAGRLTRGGFLALDAVLGVEELAGLALSNRPRGALPPRAARVVLVADRFPAPGDPLGDFALSLAGARVEAAARPGVLDHPVARRLAIAYREDDGAAARAWAAVRLVVRHPLRCAVDVIRRGPRGAGGPALTALAPAARRLLADGDVPVQPLGGPAAHAVARRLAALAGRSLRA